ncbi:leucine-rich repeat flightless-interacting protein 1 [Fukomys damarensis]|uniref:leucine-rich repeat flightless-interacting protein 1 n=1 Tax=Fukomys damarensis TaxID=885580 RepID=UPI001455D07B|nr:leucine-rich repeat flightless-interacting protein 1 [Fukomys damarensis]
MFTVVLRGAVDRGDRPLSAPPGPWGAGSSGVTRILSWSPLSSQWRPSMWGDVVFTLEGNRAELGVLGEMLAWDFSVNPTEERMLSRSFQGLSALVCGDRIPPGPGSRLAPPGKEVTEDVSAISRDPGVERGPPAVVSPLLRCVRNAIRSTQEWLQPCGPGSGVPSRGDTAVGAGPSAGQAPPLSRLTGSVQHSQQDRAGLAFSCLQPQSPAAVPRDTFLGSGIAHILPCCLVHQAVLSFRASGRSAVPTKMGMRCVDLPAAWLLGCLQAEARLAAKRAARAEAREIRMKELERQQKEIYQVQKKYYGLDTKWGDIEQWMEDSERYSHRPRRRTSASDEDERLSVGSRGSLRSQPELEYGGPYAWTNGYEGDLYGSQPPSRRSGRASSLCFVARPAGSYRAPVLQDSSIGGARRGSACGSLAPSECSGHLNSGSRASSRASSARASPVVEERPEKDFTEKGTRSMPGLSAATLASLGGTSSRRGSGDTSISVDTEASLREIKDSLAEVEEKYKKAMVSNAQLDNEKTNFMYQVDALKDTLLELEEELAESRRQCEQKSKEFERERHAHSVLQFQFAEVKEALRQRDAMLEEIRQLQQKQASYIREISDLQETIEWKDKKIGALERQKEFFDSVRSERDGLREEVVKLKEEFKKHGIILNSEVAPNGETEDTLNNLAPAPTKMTKEELSALMSPGDGTRGRAKEVEVENEIVENMGKREILQNTEQEQHKEDTVKDGVDIEGSCPGEYSKAQELSKNLANAECEEQVQSQSPDSHETAEQVGSQEVPDVPAEWTGASLGHPECPEDSGSEASGPVHGLDTCNALDVLDQSEESVGRRQDQENQDWETDMEELHRKPCQGPEAEPASSADPRAPGGGHTQEEAEPGGAAAGAPGSDPERGLVDELDSSTRRGSEKELADQEAAEPGEATCRSARVGGEDSMEEEGDGDTQAEKPVPTEAQPMPGAPTAKSSLEEAPGPGRANTNREPSERKSDHQAEGSESSQKKSKNKKKKNKKKKSPMSVESLEDIKKELTYPDTDRGEVQEEQGHLAGAAQEEVAGNRTQKITAESGGCDDCPEAELDGKFNQEDDSVKTEVGTEEALGDTMDLAGNTIPSSGTHDSDEELGEGVTDGVASEPEDPDGTSSSLLQNESLSAAVEGTCQTGSPKEDTGSVGLETAGFSVPHGELGDLGSESGGPTKEGNEKSKGKEDCTMS